MDIEKYNKIVNDIIIKYDKESGVCMGELLGKMRVPSNVSFEEAFYIYMGCMYAIEGHEFYGIVKEDKKESLV